MKIKGKKLKQSHNSKVKVPLTSNFRLCAFHFSSLALCLFASAAGAKNLSGQLDPINVLLSHSAKSLQNVNKPNVLPAQTDQNELPYDDSIFTESPYRPFTYQLWRANITAPKNEEDQQNKNELQQMIEKIRSIQFESPNKTPESIVVLKPPPTTEPNESLAGTKAPEQPQQEHLQSQLQTASDELKTTAKHIIQSRNTSQDANHPLQKPISDRTLQMLQNLSQHAEQVDNPFELGEILFLSGCLKEASIFYQEALNRSPPAQADVTQDRAWILFQIGNCLRDNDQPKAVNMYRQLITEYPDSLWTDLAKFQDSLIDWYQKNEPMKLITEGRL